MDESINEKIFQFVSQKAVDNWEPSNSIQGMTESAEIINSLKKMTREAKNMIVVNKGGSFRKSILN